MATWRELREALDKIPDERLDDEASVIPPCSDDSMILPLMPVVMLGKINDCTGSKTLSEKDRKHHPDDFAILVDYNPYGPRGEMHTVYRDDGMIEEVCSHNDEVAFSPEYYYGLKRAAEIVESKKSPILSLSAAKMIRDYMETGIDPTEEDEEATTRLI